MAVWTEEKKGFHALVVSCDCCGRVIERDGDGAARFAPVRGEEGAFSIFTFHNAGRCAGVFKAPRNRPGAQIPLGALRLYLAGEMKLTEKNAERVADLLSGMEGR